MSNRRAQHREKRESNTRQNAELKEEIRKLKRQVSRLKKELTRLQEDDGEEVVEDELPKALCPECGSDKLSEIVTPGGSTRYACRACKRWRGELSL